MFSYQRNFFEETQVVTREFFWSLFDDATARYRVQRHREVKARLGEWQQLLTDEDFQAFDRDQSVQRDLKKRAAYLKLSDEDRVKAWCQWLKRSLPGLMFMGYFDVTTNSKGRQGRWRCKRGARLSGLVVLDVDHLKDDPRQVFDSWTAEQRQDMVFCMKSPGGEGLKVVFKAHPEWGNLADNIIEKALQLGQQPDLSGIDISRTCFVSLKEDIFFIDEQELFSYENPEFVETWRDTYRAGGTVYPAYHDKNDYHRTGAAAVHRAVAADAHGPADGKTVREGETTGVADAVADTLSYGAWTGTCRELMEEIYREVGLPGSQPEGMPRLSRHTESLARAYDLLVMTGRNKQRVEQLLLAQPWVQAIVDERGEDVAKTVDDADALVGKKEREYGANIRPKRKTIDAIQRLLAAAAKDAPQAAPGTLSMREWGERLATLFDDYPCLRELCAEVQPEVYPVILFASAAFLGTLLTRTWYSYWFAPDIRRRLNYCVIIIGDPASGKSVINWIYKLLCAPLLAADKVGNDAVNRYKKERNERATSTKEQRKEALKQPDVIIRCHGSRTANGVFIEDMVKAVDIVQGEPMNLHLLTFDTELDNATIASKGGQWIDKSVFELKAFHNETDDQQYRNVDSVNGPFDVFWNFVYTGTPLSLRRKVTDRNFGSGLSTRLAVIPMPATDYKMPELVQKPRTDHARQELLKTWAFRLDGVCGELPVWPLCELIYDWQKDRTAIAEFNDDPADEMLLKRIGYYGINVAAPFIVMRHWDEWQATKTFTVDDKDKELCRLVLDVQYHCQHHFFGRMARAYFDNQKRDDLENRQRASKYDQCYEQLPETFTVQDIVSGYGVNENTAAATASRLCKNGYVERLKQGQYRKLKHSLL